MSFQLCSTHLNFQMRKRAVAVACQLLSGYNTACASAPLSHNKGVLPISGEVNQVSFEVWLGADSLDERCYLNISFHDDENDYGYFGHISNTK